MSLYGVGLDVTVKKILLDFKFKITQKGGFGLKNLHKTFNLMDVNKNGKLERIEFEKALASFGLFPKRQDLQALFNYFDLDLDGGINYEEFFNSLREPLSEERKKLVTKAFNSIDKIGRGAFNREEMIANYPFPKHPDFATGKLTKEQLVDEILKNFEKEPNGDISYANFFFFYEELGTTIPSDTAFKDLILKTWFISISDEAEIFKEELKAIIKTIRNKLIQKTNGSHEEFLLRKLFRHYDLNKSGYLTIDELDAMLLKLECPVDKKFLGAIFLKFDANKNGYIEFNEFANFIFQDPYP